MGGEILPFLYWSDTLIHMYQRKKSALVAQTTQQILSIVHMYPCIGPRRQRGLLRIITKSWGIPPSPFPVVYNMRVPTRVTSMNRAKIINSLCKMFNQVHNNQTTPDWLLELHNSSDNDTLSARMGNWMRNYPEEFRAHGVYIM